MIERVKGCQLGMPSYSGLFKQSRVCCSGKLEKHDLEPKRELRLKNSSRCMQLLQSDDITMRKWERGRFLVSFSVLITSRSVPVGYH